MKTEEQIIEELAGVETAVVRQRLAIAKLWVNQANESIKSAELRIREAFLSSAGGDPKAIGPNEGAREDRYQIGYRNDEEWGKAREKLAEASKDAEIAQAILNGRLDLVTERRINADERRTDVIAQALEKSPDFALSLAS